MKLNYFSPLNFKVLIIVAIHILFVSTSFSNLDEDIVIKPITYEKNYLSITIQSSILDEPRELLVHLPTDYNESHKKYPLLLLLDGNRHLPHALLAEQILQQESLIPQSVIVAIPNKPGTRNRDLRIEKKKFIKFIEREVISYVEKNYRVSKQKSIFGHSMAGYFVLYMLANNQELFDNYIAASPVIQVNESELTSLFNKLSKVYLLKKKSLFITLTDQRAEGVEATKALNQFVTILKNKTFENLNWKYQFIPNQVHMTTPYLTLYQGLTYIFDDYRMPTFAGFDEYNKRGGMQGLQHYYVQRANKYQTSTQVPERAVRRLGYAILDDKHYDEAIQIFKNNSNKNPQSAGALNALAEAYEESQYINKALETYKSAHKLSVQESLGSVHFFARQIKRLESIINELK